MIRFSQHQSKPASSIADLQRFHQAEQLREYRLTLTEKTISQNEHARPGRAQPGQQMSRGGFQCIVSLFQPQPQAGNQTQ